MSDVFGPNSFDEQRQILTQRVEEARDLNTKIYEDYNAYANQPGMEGVSDYEKIKTFSFLEVSCLFLRRKRSSFHIN